MNVHDIFKKSKNEYIDERQKNSDKEIIISDEEPILKITENSFIDTTSKVALAKYKHNLKILYEKIKKKNEITKFALIRDDDFFPYDNRWLVNSKDTIIEKKNIALSIVLKEQYALEKENLYKKYGNIIIPPDKEKINEAIKKLPTNFAAIYTPAHFRSNKHFTINTPLSITGDYNSVSDNRNFTIIDDITNFLNSPYVYSIAAHDAYLDVCHEPLIISDKAIILINKNTYEKLKNNKQLMNELNNKNVIIYQGEEFLAINMILTEHGIMPSKVGKKFLEDNDNLVEKLTESSLKKIAKSKNIYYDQSHGGKINDATGHFSNYFDEKNNDYNESIISLVNFLEKRFKRTISIGMLIEENKAQKLVTEIGTEELLKAIYDYNNQIEKEHEIIRKKYLEDRKKITPEISEIFVRTTKTIDNFYKEKLFNNYSIKELEKLEEKFRLFFQSSTVEDQLKNASKILTILQRNQNLKEILDENTKDIYSEKKTNKF